MVEGSEADFYILLTSICNSRLMALRDVTRKYLDKENVKIFVICGNSSNMTKYS